jgi:glycosyltransferase involved in cell wall biosynthesis
MHKNKNILYIGPYREYSGAGNAARNYIQALYEFGHDVCIAPIFYTGETYPENEISSDILPLENNHLKRYDVVIQHCHPFDYVYSNKFEMNIGLYQFSSDSVKPAIVSRLMMMDRIILNSEHNKKIIDSLSSSINSIVVPELIDINLKNESYIEYSWLKRQPNPIVFYTIGDFIERKNIQDIIRAFLYTFRDNENVELIIKTKPHYSHKQQDFINKELEYYIDKIYASLRMDKKNNKQPKIMVGQFDYRYLLALHKNSNIYIDASMAENFGYTCLEASLFDNYLIVNENSSTMEISSASFPTTSRPVSVLDSYTANFVDNTVEDFWYHINFEDLCKNMMKAYLQAVVSPKQKHDLSRYEYKNIESMII